MIRPLNHFIRFSAVVLLAVFTYSCAPYYATRVAYPTSIDQLTEAIQKTAFNLPDISLIADKGLGGDPGASEEWYVGMRSRTSAIYGVRSAPVLGIRAAQSINGSVVHLTSTGDERVADVFAAALEQELADENRIPKDSPSVAYISHACQIGVASTSDKFTQPRFGIMVRHG